MGPKKSNARKRRKTKNQSLPTSNSTIECLNDDCMLEIFKYLTINEKIVLESVCKNWNRVVKLTWNKINSLEFHKIVPYRHNINQDAFKIKINTNYLITILKKCGNYLHKVDIDSDDIDSLFSSNILNEISNYCKNITSVHFSGDLDDNLFFTDANLRNLFHNNKKINSVALTFIKINGDCLLNLNTNCIKELYLSNFQFKTSGYLYAFIGNLRNLNKIVILDNGDKIVQILGALIMSKCENIHEIIIDVYKNSKDIDNLLLFVSKQTKIRVLELNNVFIDQNFLNKLSKDNLEILDFNNVKTDREFLNFSSFLSQQTSLRVLGLKNVPIKDNSLGNNLKSIRHESFLEELILKFDKIQHGNQINLSLFLSKHQKIQKIKLFNVFIFEKLMNRPVNKSKMVSLKELKIKFSATQTEKVVSDISLFLTRLKGISKFSLMNVVIDEKLILSLPVEILEELNLEFTHNKSCDTILKCFDRFQNLQVLKLFFHEFTDVYLLSLTECINENIKKIEIHFNIYLPSGKPISNFTRLQKLKSFYFINRKEDSKPFIDNLLKDLSKCKDLNYLGIETCRVTNLGLKSLSNLTKFEIKSSKNFDYEFLELIENSINLNEIKFEDCNNVTNNLVNKASEIKVKRGDIHELKIIFEGECPEIDSENLRNAPLVKAFY